MFRKSRKWIFLAIIWGGINCTTDLKYNKNPIRANMLEITLGEKAKLLGSDTSHQNVLSVDCRIKSLSTKPLVLKQLLGRDKIISNELQRTNTGIYLLPGKEVFVENCARIKKKEGVEVNVVYEELPTLRFETFNTDIKTDD
jgi:hypothetical protein